MDGVYVKLLIEIVFAIIVAIIVGVCIYKVFVKLEEKKRIDRMQKRIEEQDRLFFNDGNQVDIKGDILNLNIPKPKILKDNKESQKYKVGLNLKKREKEECKKKKNTKKQKKSQKK